MALHSKRRGIWITGILLLLVLILGAVLGTLWLTRLPGLPQQAAARSGLAVFITAPGDRTAWPADAVIPIAALVQSAQPLQSVTLFSNGLVVAEQGADPQQTSGVFSFRWQPPQTGGFSLQVRATTTTGVSVVSDPVRVTISTPVGAVAEITLAQETSLDQIAQVYAANPQDITRENPGMDFSQPLPAGTSLRLPLTLPTATPVSATPTPQPQNVPALSPVTQPPVLQNLSYFLASRLKAPGKAPSAPTLQVVTAGCDIRLIITDTSDNESGFFIYRASASTSDLVKIATLPAHEGSGAFSYLDPGQSGQVIYVAAAYNTAGESQSDPLAVTPDAAACPAPAAPQSSAQPLVYQLEVLNGPLVVENHRLKFPQAVDLAYLYISINGREWERIPPGTLKFLPGTGDQFNLDDYLDSLIQKIPDPRLEIVMEIWGWTGGQLVDYGTVKISLERTVLQVCALPNIECGAGLWSPEIFISPALQPQNLSYAFTWQTPYPDQAKDVYLQIATRPFTGDEIGQVQSLLLSQGIFNGQTTFTFNFNYLYNDQPFRDGQWHYGTFEYTSNWFQGAYPPPDSAFTLYARAVVYNKEHARISTSNTVILHYLTDKQSAPKPVYASDLPSLYEVKFLPQTYSGPTLLREDRWGCIVLNDAVFAADPTFLKFSGFSQADLDADGDGCTNPVSPTCNGKAKPLLYPSGSMICPANYVKPSGFWNDLKSLASGIWNGVTSAWESLVTAFENAKQYLTDQIASVIPGCGDTCKAAIKKGLEVGFTALTGLPPSLPSYDELKEEGISYAVDVIAEEIGPDCDDLCRSLIDKGVRETIAIAESSQSSPGCVDAGQAHAHGKEPLCFPTDARIRWSPAPGVAYQPAVISLQVTRKPLSLGANQPNSVTNPLDKSGQYRIWVDSLGTNATRIGDWFPLCGFKEGLDGSNATGYTDSGGGYPLKRQINEALQGPLYQPLGFSIPALSPGESITIPIGFSPEQYLRPNHQYDVSQTDASFQDFLNTCGDDWPYLYYNGQTTLNAVEQCLNPQGEWVPCSGGGQDTFVTTNPSAPN